MSIVYNNYTRGAHETCVSIEFKDAETFFRYIADYFEKYCSGIHPPAEIELRPYRENKYSVIADGYLMGFAVRKNNKPSP